MVADGVNNAFASAAITKRWAISLTGAMSLSKHVIQVVAADAR